MRKELERCGFTEYRPVLEQGARAAFQKCVRCPNHGNKLYYINIIEYDGHTGNRTTSLVYEARVQLENKYGLTFNLDILAGFKLPQVEIMVAKAYKSMDCVPYSPQL